VTYTVWLGDRFIGEADLTSERVEPRYCSGRFIPAPGNEEVVPTTDPSLQIRDSNGRVVPTDWVTVYDLDENLVEDDDLEFDEPYDPELEASIEHDAALVREWIEAREAETVDESDDESFGEDEEFSRYHIQIRLAADAAIA
jgi:hypothetical protein